MEEVAKELKSELTEKQRVIKQEAFLT